jgi:carboxymethylenebutenolidase
VPGVAEAIRPLLTGGDRRDIASSNRARAMVEADPGLVPELARLTGDPDWLIGQRALDHLEKLAHDHPEWVAPHKRIFIGPLARSRAGRLRQAQDPIRHAELEPVAYLGALREHRRLSANEGAGPPLEREDAGHEHELAPLARLRRRCENSLPNPLTDRPIRPGKVLMPRRLVLGPLLLAGCTLQHTARPGPLLDDHMAHMSAADMAAPASDAAGRDVRQQGVPGLPPSNLSASARLAASPRHGEWVKIALEAGSADSMMAWVVYPSTSRKAPVVVVVHEIFGLSTWVRGVADQVAADGFVAIAPDFLSRLRGGPSSIELPADSARRLIPGVNSTERNRIIVAAANWAMTQPSATQRYAVIGYCWGGGTTFMHAIHGGVSGFSGGVAFYGLPYASAGTPATATTPAVPATLIADSVAKIKVPMLLLNGSKDARISAAMPALDSMMKAMGKTYTGVNYDGAVHGFLRAQDDPKTQRDEAEEQANLAAAKDAWPKTIAFLKQRLGM